MKNLKTFLSVGAIILALGGLGLTAQSIRRSAPTLQQARPAAAPIVRTRVVHRTVHIVRRAKAKHTSKGAGTRAAATVSRVAVAAPAPAAPAQAAPVSAPQSRYDDHGAEHHGAEPGDGSSVEVADD